MRSALQPSFGDQLLARGSTPKKSMRVGMPLLDGDLGDVGGGLDAQHRNAERHEVLQQVAVVAGELDDEAVRPEPAPLTPSSRSSALACATQVVE